MSYFKSLEEVYDHYEDNVIKIVNRKQILFYADVCSVQPDWIGQSIYDGRLIAYYGRERTRAAFERWMANRPKAED